MAAEQWRAAQLARAALRVRRLLRAAYVLNLVGAGVSSGTGMGTRVPEVLEY